MVTAEWTPRHFADARRQHGHPLPARQLDQRPDGTGSARTTATVSASATSGAGRSARSCRSSNGKFRLGATIFGQTGSPATTTTGNTAFTRQNTPIEWNVEGRMRMPMAGWEHWFAGVGAGSLIAPGYGAPDFRIVALVGTYFVIEDTNPHSPDARARIRASIRASLKDTDGDGIPDDVDACPTEPEDHKDPDPSDGCPAPTDRDGDGIPDAVRQVPRRAGGQGRHRRPGRLPRGRRRQRRHPRREGRVPEGARPARSGPEEERLPEVHPPRGLDGARAAAGALRDRLGHDPPGQLPDADGDRAAPEGEPDDQEDDDRGPHRQPRRRRHEPRPLEAPRGERARRGSSSTASRRAPRQRGLRHDEAHRDERHGRGAPGQPARRVQESPKRTREAGLRRRRSPIRSWRSGRRGWRSGSPAWRSGS